MDFCYDIWSYLRPLPLSSLPCRLVPLTFPFLCPFPEPFCPSFSLPSHPQTPSLTLSPSAFPSLPHPKSLDVSLLALTLPGPLLPLPSLPPSLEAPPPSPSFTLPSELHFPTPSPKLPQFFLLPSPSPDHLRLHLALPWPSPSPPPTPSPPPLHPHPRLHLSPAAPSPSPPAAPSPSPPPTPSHPTRLFPFGEVSGTPSEWVRAAGRCGRCGREGIRCGRNASDPGTTQAFPRRRGEMSRRFLLRHVRGL